MAVLIDTSVLVEHDRERTGLGSLVARAEGAVSVVTVSELLHGARRAPAAARALRLARVDHLLASFIPVPITEEIARVHAEIWVDLETRGHMIGAHDLWIAATALAHDLGVLTLDDHFERVPGLRVVAP